MCIGMNIVALSKDQALKEVANALSLVLRPTYSLQLDYRKKIVAWSWDQTIVPLPKQLSRKGKKIYIHDISYELH